VVLPHSMHSITDAKYSLSFTHIAPSLEFKVVLKYQKKLRRKDSVAKSNSLTAHSKQSASHLKVSLKEHSIDLVVSAVLHTKLLAA